MGGCIDKKYGDMLHAFELGLLTDEDYEQFRLHLFDCQYCFEKASEFEAAAELLRNDPDFRGVPRQIVSDENRTDERTIAPHKSRFVTSLIPISAIAALLFVFLILKPWHIEITPHKDAVAAENRLAIFPFENMAVPDDPERLGEIASNLLITDLSESGFLTVLSNQRLSDILTLMGEDPDQMPDDRISIQAAEKARAKWVLTGKILQSTPNLIVSSQIVDVATGDVIGSVRITGDAGDNIFSLVDKLSVRLKDNLGLPVAANKEPDRRVAEFTTTSPLAYRYYLEGVTQYQRYYNTEALQSFEKALAIDSGFAMVYYYLSLLKHVGYIDQALAYLDRAGTEDQYLIKSRKAFLTGQYRQGIAELEKLLQINVDNKQAYYQIGAAYSLILEHDKAIENLKKAVTIDPLYKVAYNQMAYAYDWLCDFENALQAIDMYISIAPDEPNPYDSRGDILMSNGKLEEAISSFTQALDIKPDYWISLQKLGKCNLLLGNYRTADSCFLVLSECDIPDWQAAGLTSQAYRPIFEGKFDSALTILDSGIESIISTTGHLDYSAFNNLKAIVYEEKNQFERAVDEIAKAIDIYKSRNPNNKIYGRCVLTQLQAKSGNLELAQATAVELDKHLRSLNDTLRYWYALASIEQARGNLVGAISLFEKAAEDSIIPYTPANCNLALAYQEAERWEDAVIQLNKVIDNDFTDTRFDYGAWYAKTHYYLGISYEAMGQSDEAIKRYQIFLDLWKYADPDISLIADARERLSRLMNAP